MIKTKDLTGAALDWAVARAVGLDEPLHIRSSEPRVWTADHSFGYSPSTNWAHGGPLIEKYQVIYRHHVGCVEACCMTGEIGVNRKRAAPVKGVTLLEAACRSIVALKLGANVEIPKELIT